MTATSAADDQNKATYSLGCLPIGHLSTGNDAAELEKSAADVDDAPIAVPLPSISKLRFFGR